MDGHFYSTLAIIWALAAITPGPNFFITLQMAVTQSCKAALCCIAGIISATAIWALLGYGGLTALFHLIPALYLVFKVLGAGYLIYLGIKLLRISGKPGDIPPVTRGLHSMRRCYVTGFLTNMLNPKSAIFITSLFATVIPAEHSLSSGVLSAALMSSVSAGWYLLVAVLFSRARVQHIYLRWRATFAKLIGGCFVLFGIRLGMTQ